MRIKPDMNLLTIYVYVHFNEMDIKSNRGFCESHFFFCGEVSVSGMKSDFLKSNILLFSNMS